MYEMSPSTQNKGGGEMTDEEARELAEAHWKWLESLLHKVYVDAMVHGIKHGNEVELK